MTKRKILLKIYDKLLDHFGKQNWWPAATPFEVIIGAILTQNTSWKNVEKAILNLKKAGVMSPARIHPLPIKKLSLLVKPAGYYNIKAKRIKSFVNHLQRNYKGHLKRLLKKPIQELREELLGISGIGPETADSIILYAAHKPIFVIDAYTKRIIERHNLSESTDYDEIQRMFMRNLAEDVQLFNDYHAQIVAVGKEYCRRKPNCINCPLKDIR